MLQEMSSTEIKLERERVAKEKRKLEEARLVCWQLTVAWLRPVDYGTLDFSLANKTPFILYPKTQDTQ